MSNEHMALVSACKKNVLRGLLTVEQAVDMLRANGVHVNDFLIDELSTLAEELQDTAQ